MSEREIPVAAISTTGRLRQVDPARAEALAVMIADGGLLQPIEVVAEGEAYRLVYGLHRLEAHRILGRETIPSKVLAEGSLIEAELRLREILENMGQRPLSALDRAVHLAAWKDVYEALHPSARHGGKRTKASPEEAEQEQVAKFATRFSAVVQNSIGLGERAIRLAITIARGIPPAVRERIALTWLADHQVSLQALAAEPVARQEAVCDLLLSDPPKAGSVADALALLDGTTTVPTPAWSRLAGSLTRLPKVEQFAALDAIAPVVEEWRRARGLA